MSYCKKCFNVRCQQRWRRRKLEFLAEMGNCCTYCKLRVEDSPYAVFEFYHLDPAQKDAD